MKMSQFAEIAVPLARQKRIVRRERIARRTSGQRFCQVSRQTKKAVVHTKRCARISVAGTAISANWLIFIWAVNANRVLETSLGYFMTPIANVLFGTIFLRERSTRFQVASVLLAALGVLNLTLGYGRFPWVALGLCCSWGVYALLRKLSGTAAIPGLFFETTMLLPLAILYLVVLASRGVLVFGPAHPNESFILIASGVVTGLPLVWFGYAARHLRLTTIGFLQYLAPSGTFFLGVFLYHEPFTRAHLITFSLIWSALVVFTFETVRVWHSNRAAVIAVPPIAD